jgi:hypothetical protein
VHGKLQVISSMSDKLHQCVIRACTAEHCRWVTVSRALSRRKPCRCNGSGKAYGALARSPASCRLHAAWSE